MNDFGEESAVLQEASCIYVWLGGCLSLLFGRAQWYKPGSKWNNGELCLKGKEKVIVSIKKTVQN